MNSTDGSDCKIKGSVTGSSVPGMKKKSTELVVNVADKGEEYLHPSKVYHPGRPLKLEIKSIKNSTRTDAGLDLNNLLLNAESGRSFITAAVLVSWIVAWSWRTFWSFLVVHGIDFLWTSIKYKLGFSNDYHETYITLGNDGSSDAHNKKHPHRNDLGLKVSNSHGWPTHHGNGPHGHQNHYPKRHVYKTHNAWYHPASKYFEQPTYQYHPHGQEYTLLGYDQHKALKYRKKYNKKFEKFKSKDYRQKSKAEKKAERRRKKAEKWQRFKDKFSFKKAGDDDDQEDSREDSSEIENGHAPHTSYYSSYDYDPLPGKNQNQHIFRIRL